MSVLGKVLCAAGLHSGTWSYPGRRCETTRTCDRCGRAEEVVRHTWGQYGYGEAGRCDQARRCGRCGSVDHRTTHQWGPWLYLNTEFNSPQFHVCVRCHETERTAPTLR